MALRNNKISTTYVGNTLGTSSRDVGTLCSHPNINKWSKWKPIKHSKVDELTILDLKSKNYGFTPITFNLNEIPNSSTLESSRFIWGDYLRPTGGINSPYRMGDFRNYNHQAIKPIHSVIMRNSNNGTKVIAGNVNYPQYRPNYTAYLTFNINSDIKLTDFNFDEIENYRLTIVISANIAGISSSEMIFAQSVKTIGEAYNDGDPHIQVVIDTYDVIDVFNGVNNNIVSVYLAPEINNVSEIMNIENLSIKMDNSIISNLYNSNYAIYGDGGEGGTTPTSIAMGSWNWVSNEPYMVGGYLYFDFLRVTVSQTAQSYGDLLLWVDELNREYNITTGGEIPLGVSYQQTIDTTLKNPYDLQSNFIDPFTGNPITQLTCRFYIRSNTTGVSTVFNDGIYIIQVQ